MKYPSGIKKKYTTTTSYANRGMSLEEDINITNKYYLDNNIGIIHKKPTPITITKVDYPSRLEAVIKEAYFRTPSTTDYNGIYKGKYIDFDVKESKSKTSFPLKNIHLHQIEHIKKIIEHGGIGFFIVRFTTLNLTYYLDGSKLISFIENSEKKSIPISFFEEEGYLIKINYNPRVDYLKVIDKIYFQGGSNE